MNAPEQAVFELVGRQTVELFILRQQIEALSAQLRGPQEAMAQAVAPAEEKGATRAED